MARTRFLMARGYIENRHGTYRAVMRYMAHIGRASARDAEGAVLGEMYKNAGKWYNLTVQVAAGRTIKYTALLRHRCESRYLSADGVSFGVAV